jgi:hypothetical protein
MGEASNCTERGSQSLPTEQGLLALKANIDVGHTISVGTDWINKRPINNRANFSIIDYRPSIIIIIDLGGEGPGRIYPSYSLF